MWAGVLFPRGKVVGWLVAIIGHFSLLWGYDYSLSPSQGFNGGCGDSLAQKQAAETL
jgi:hypothetical protein